MDANGNYKGLMLCSRPNDEIKIIVQKPFISRVNPHEDLGLNHAPKPNLNKPYRKENLVLRRHME